MSEKVKTADVCVQVIKKRGKSKEIQTQLSFMKCKSVATQCGEGEEKGSYQRKKCDRIGHWTYDKLNKDVLSSKRRVVSWLMEKKLIASIRLCPQCDSAMKLVECEDRSDGCKWECRKQVNAKRHKVELSIRNESWFEGSNLTLEEIMKLTYWWCRGVEQETMRFEVDVSGNTVVDWDSFCREICEVNYLECKEKVGGPDKRVQIDESKFGKRKYHRGHRVEGQWVFGGIEEGSRKSFLFAVDDRSEATLLPIIQTFIAEGTTVISDCWKAYSKLEKHGYKHLTVNHSKEFVNKDGDHTNKIEGHWRQAKAKLPPFGLRKHTFSSYLAEFMWRYEHKGEDLFEVFLEDAKKIYGKF
jgi:transposase-like protein